MSGEAVVMGEAVDWHALNERLVAAIERNTNATPFMCRAAAEIATEEVRHWFMEQHQNAAPQSPDGLGKGR